MFFFSCGFRGSEGFIIRLRRLISLCVDVFRFWVGFREILVYRVFF